MRSKEVLPAIVTAIAAVLGALVAGAATVYAGGTATWDQWSARGAEVPFLFVGLAALAGAIVLGFIAWILSGRYSSAAAQADKSGGDRIEWDNTGNLYWVGHDLTYALLALQADLPRERVLWGLRHGLHHARALGFRDGTVEGPLAVLVHEVMSLTDAELTAERREQLVPRIWAVINKIGAVLEAHQPDFVAHPPDIGQSRS